MGKKIKVFKKMCVKIPYLLNIAIEITKKVISKTTLYAPIPCHEKFCPEYAFSKIVPPNERNNPVREKIAKINKKRYL